MRASLYQSVAAAGWTPQSGSVTPAAHPLSIHFPSAQVIKKHLCFSIRLHVWGECLSHHLEEGGELKSPLELSCGVAQGPLPVSPSRDRSKPGKITAPQNLLQNG